MALTPLCFVTRCDFRCLTNALFTPRGGFRNVFNRLSFAELIRLPLHDNIGHSAPILFNNLDLIDLIHICSNAMNGSVVEQIKFPNGLEKSEKSNIFPFFWLWRRCFTNLLNSPPREISKKNLPQSESSGRDFPSTKRRGPWSLFFHSIWEDRLHPVAFPFGFLGDEKWPEYSFTRKNNTYANKWMENLWILIGL